MLPDTGASGTGNCIEKEPMYVLHAFNQRLSPAMPLLAYNIPKRGCNTLCQGTMNVFLGRSKYNRFTTYTCTQE